MAGPRRPQRFGTMYVGLKFPASLMDCVRMCGDAFVRRPFGAERPQKGPSNRSEPLCFGICVVMDVLMLRRGIAAHACFRALFRLKGAALRRIAFRARPAFPAPALSFFFTSLGAQPKIIEAHVSSADQQRVGERVSRGAFWAPSAPYIGESRELAKCNLERHPA